MLSLWNVAKEIDVISTGLTSDFLKQEEKVLAENEGNKVECRDPKGGKEGWNRCRGAQE